MDTDISWCINDGACERVGACNAFEHVTIKRKKVPRSRLPELALDSIPEPQKRKTEEVWRCVLTGVGGMGFGLATSILVRAGHKEGHNVIFLDKKGLAIRNGGVVSQVVYNIAQQPITAVIPYGKADLLIGVDILEAARTLDPRGRVRIASPDRTAAVINTDKVQTIPGTMGLSDYDPSQLETLIRQYTRPDDFLARNISRICEKYLGSKLYANIMMLGFAFQKGLIPVSMHSMAWAIKDTIRADFRKNLYAFNMGRKLVVQSDLFQGPPVRADWREVLEEKCRWTIRRYRAGVKMADDLRELTARTVQAADALEESLKRAIVVRTYDCMRWGGMEYARRYADAVRDVCAKDSAEHGFAVTRAVIHNLASAMLIKDAVFTAELSTSPEKQARDREKYNINPSLGDRIVYRYLWNPTFRIGRRETQYNLTLSSNTLQLLKRMPFLRKLPFWQKPAMRYRDLYESRVLQFIQSSPDEYALHEARLGSARCMNCMNPRCKEAGCPLSNRIPQWVQLACDERWQDASEALHETNNFPEFTSRICPAPCQDQCKQGAGGYPVQVRGIESQIIERAFNEGWVRPQLAKQKTGKKVAVIGSGPAGLAAAQQLARSGHNVTVFDRDDRAGGLLRYGIPEFRLNKKLVDRRLHQLQAEGVEFRLGVDVGKDMPAAKLREEFDAVCLAMGALRPRDIKAAGRDVPGIHFAMDFLRQQNQRDAADGASVTFASPEILAKDKVTVVIGGGLTGEDCVETALRQGAMHVHQFEILPPSAKNLLADDGEHDLSKVTQHFCAAVREMIAGPDGKIAQIRAVRVQWVPSASGPVMKDVPDSEFSIRADVVLLAMGFTSAVEADTAKGLGIKTDPTGRPVVKDCTTTASNVFAAGDLVSGASYVVTAIASGRKTAEKINEYLAKIPATQSAASEAKA